MFILFFVFSAELISIEQNASLSRVLLGILLIARRRKVPKITIEHFEVDLEEYFADGVPLPIIHKHLLVAAVVFRFSTRLTQYFVNFADFSLSPFWRELHVRRQTVVGLLMVRHLLHLIVVFALNDLQLV